MHKFDQAFQLLLKHEGGFVNNPLDMGGPTNMGITQGDLAHFYNRPISLEEIQKLSVQVAKEYYKAKFWDHMKLDLINTSKVATLIFDQAVLRGPGRVIQDVQHILGLDPDSIMGPQTLEEINKQSELPFGIKIIKSCQLAYVYIAQAKPSQVEFLSGWITRTHSLMDFLLFSV